MLRDSSAAYCVPVSFGTGKLLEAPLLLEPNRRLLPRSSERRSPKRDDSEPLPRSRVAAVVEAGVGVVVAAETACCVLGAVCACERVIVVNPPTATAAAVVMARISVRRFMSGLPTSRPERPGPCGCCCCQCC